MSKRSIRTLEEELERKRGKLCFSCKKFRHLAYNYRNKEEKEKRKTVHQNKFEILRSWVM